MSRVQVPQDVDVERSLLATLCMPGAEHSAALCLPNLCREDFMHPAHQAVLEALRTVLKLGREPGLVVLADELNTQNNLHRVGGITGLAEILGAEEVGRPQALVDILVKHRRRRELLRLGHQLRTNAQDSIQDPDELVHETQVELARITRDGRRDEGEGWMEILHTMANSEPFRREGPGSSGFWGLPTLDQVAPIPAGEYTTIGARPGVGKTALMTQIAIESARKGLRVLVLTLELPRESMRARLASYLSKVPVGVLKRGDYTTHHTLTVGHQAGLLELGRIQAPTAGTPWSRLEAIIRLEVDRFGIQLVLLDQFDKIGRPPVGRGSSEAYAFGAVSTSIMALAKDLNIGFCLMCQLKGDAEGREPSLADHADSDRPGKDASVVLHLWRDRKGDLLGKLQKNRDGAFVGKRFNFDFDGRCQQFREIEQDTGDPGYLPAATGLFQTVDGI